MEESVTRKKYIEAEDDQQAMQLIDELQAMSRKGKLEAMIELQ